MTFPWSPENPDPRQHSARSAVETNASDDLGMIPWWSVVLAITAFAGMQYVFFGHIARGPGPQRSFGPMHFLMAYSWGTLVASYVLLIGYVSRDVKRRNMQPALWMLMVVLMPGGIGAVVYFLLRQPILSRCPHCSTEIAASYHFCPQCSFQMAPVCGQCFRGVEITDVYCKQCGHDLEKDQVPARLRAFRD
jgi:Double zinc ribbon